MQERNITRRKFLQYAAPLAGAAILSACGVAVPSNNRAPDAINAEQEKTREIVNTSFAKELRDHIGYVSGMQQKELALEIWKRQKDPRWGVNTQFGEYIGANNTPIKLITGPTGELALPNYQAGLPDREYSIENPGPTLKIQSPGTSNFLIVYGDEQLKSKIKSQQQLFTRFIDEVFTLSKAQLNVYHINGLPITERFSPEGTDGNIMFDINTRKYAFAATFSLPSEDHATWQIHGIAINLNRMEGYQRVTGFTPYEMLLKSIADEEANLLAIQAADPREVTLNDSEAASLLSGYASALDTTDHTFSNTLFGGTSYQEVIPVLTEAMREQKASVYTPTQ
jgi:hypothetical protein